MKKQNNPRELSILVTGGAGFIGSHLVDKLVEKGDKVTVLDNLSTGNRQFLKQHENNNKFRLIEGDITDTKSVETAIKGVDIVYHLAANSDTIKGAEKTDIDLKMNTVGTYNVLEAMRTHNVKKIVFISTSTVYGYVKGEVIREDHGPLKPTSLYGASKLACEGLISAYCSMFNMQGWIFRLANILGPRLTHSATYDFINKLRKNPRELEILGNGNQKKPYVHVRDCIDGMLTGLESQEAVNIFNISVDSQTSVREIAEIVSKEMKLTPKFVFTGGETGWPGDLPSFMLDYSKLRSLGWKPKYTSNEAVETAVKEILKN